MGHDVSLSLPRHDAGPCGTVAAGLGVAGALGFGTPRGAGMLTRTVAGENALGTGIRNAAAVTGAVGGGLANVFGSLPIRSASGQIVAAETGAFFRTAARKIANSELFKTDGQPVLQQDKSRMRKELEGETP